MLGGQAVMKIILLSLLSVVMVGCANSHAYMAIQSDSPELKQLKEDIAVLHAEETVLTRNLERFKKRESYMDSLEKLRLQRDLLQAKVRFLEAESNAYWNASRGPY
jgi:hypothetical protein